MAGVVYNCGIRRRPSLFREIASDALSIGSWLYPQSHSRRFRGERTLLPLPGLEAELLDHQGHSLVSTVNRNKQGD
jgi:hypothetical protein